ncbi:MAG TPA: hypothetical protein VF546_20645 [Pyrinomonadaceae bacterium]|jgi:hypothetical protein
MRKHVTYLTAALLCCMLALAFAPTNRLRTAQADPPPERCNECVLHVQQRFDQCLAVHGQDELRCYDQYNEGIVQCYRNFCEQ